MRARGPSPDSRKTEEGGGAGEDPRLGKVAAGSRWRRRAMKLFRPSAYERGGWLKVAAQPVVCAHYTRTNHEIEGNIGGGDGG